MHQRILREHNFSIAGSVASVNWEAFASILTHEQGKAGYGSDLIGYEVKSSLEHGSFEYQYHLNGGRTKLLDDMVVDHIFVSYSPDYKNIDVRLVEGKILKPIFESWMQGLIENYEGVNRKQRYRKSIALGTVVKNGQLILTTRNGELDRQTV